MANTIRWDKGDDLQKTDLWVVATDGKGKPTRLTGDRANDRHPKWSHDGSLIAFQSDPLTDLGAQAAPSQPPSTIWVVSANGSVDATQITKVGNPPGGHGAPAWSADGKQVPPCLAALGTSE